MEKIICNIIYNEGKEKQTAKFDFTLTSTTPVIENPFNQTAIVVIDGTPFQTDISYDDLITKKQAIK